MRDDICTIPVSEVFEKNDGCPICRMRDTSEQHIIEYIMGDAMMEPDVRIETNRVGFCDGHYEKMFNRRGRLQLALMLQTHVESVNKAIFEKKIFTTDKKKGEKAGKISDSCFICDKVEWGLSRMIETIYRCYENEEDFRKLYNGQSFICLPHYEMLISGADKRQMRNRYSEFLNETSRIACGCAKELYDDISKYCTMYDYRNSSGDADWGNSRDAVERAIAFLSGKKMD